MTEIVKAFENASKLQHYYQEHMVETIHVTSIY